MMKMLFGMKKELKKKSNVIILLFKKHGQKDLETLKDYLTPQLLDAWQTKMNWYEFQEEEMNLRI